LSDFDGAWKDALDDFFPAFLAFLFPDIHADIDWSQDHEALEQEFRPLAPQAEGGRVLCDKLIRCVSRSRTDPLYLHAEVQCYRDDNFPWRVFRYNTRATDRYGTPVASLIVLGDDSPTWRPSGFHFAYFGYHREETVPAQKLLDWRERGDELLAHANSIALVILAHIKALETRQDPGERQQWRLRIVRLLFERHDPDDAQRLTRIVETLLDLPPDLEAETIQILIREREPIMPRESSFEHYARQEGRAEGRKEGHIEGRKAGIREGLLALVEVRLGQPDAGFLTLLNQATLPELEKALLAARTAASLDELKPLLAPANGQS
jgi:predicted transposase YdaD